ncbi:MAG: 50S ribosomal protein L25 [Tissierellia bacterium]|nr:50S ribosomal protein L25 [Tissierellia bacterium]
MADYKISLKKREDLGKNKVNKLRNDGQIPGVLYSKGEEAIHVYGAKNEVEKISNEAGTSNLVDVDLDGEKTLALFKEIQKHPYKNQILHFDMQGVSLSEKLRISIPVVLENRDNIQVQPSVLLQLLDEVEVEVLASNLPSEALVDVANMQLNDVLTVADTDVAKIDGITVITDLDEPVASLSEPREEVIEDDLGEGLEDTSAADVPTVDETEAGEAEEE